MEVFDRDETRTYYTRPMSPAPSESIARAPVSPIVVDAQALAHGRSTWETVFADQRFTRLTDIAVSDKPALVMKLQFDLVSGKPVVHGAVQGTVELVCQRCMQPMQQPVTEEFDLVLIENEDQLKQISETQEAWITNVSRLDVLALAEEQVLLALPLIPRHEDECITAAAVSANATKTLAASRAKAQRKPDAIETDSQRPFANLRDLLRK